MSPKKKSQEKKNPIAICQEIFGDLPFNTLCQRVHAFGYEGIEIAPFKFADDVRKINSIQRQEIRKTAIQNQIRLCACHWLLVSPPNLHITSPDPKIITFTAEYFKAMIEFAHDLEIPILVFGSPKQRSIAPEWNKDQAYQQGVTFFQKMGDIAQDFDVTIAFEPLGPSITNFGATCAESMQLLKAINHPKIKLLLDIAAMSRDPLPSLDQIQMVDKNMLVHVHLNDPNLLGPGMGALDLTPILNAIHEKGYTGWYSVETFKSDMPAEQIAKASFEYIRKKLV